MLTRMAVLMLLVLIWNVLSGTAVPLSSFYSYGSAAGDSVLPRSDDGSSPAITLPAPFLSSSIIYVSSVIQYFIALLSTDH